MADYKANQNNQNGNGNPNVNAGGVVPIARECTYQDFIKCQPLNFKGTEQVVGLTRWFEKIETVFHTNKCPKKYQVKYASCTIQDRNVIAAEPTRLQDTIRIANNLMDQKLKGYTARNDENKRRFDNDPRDNYVQQPPLKRKNVVRAYTVGNNKNKGYAVILPLCDKCKLHHHGPCPVRCGNCKKVGHQARDCWASTTMTCYGCRGKGHTKRYCLELGNQNGDGEARHNLDIVMGGLTCLFAKARFDESNLWHMRLGHINFKTMNKLVRGNLVRGLPSKIFENNHTCVACQKGKQHKTSCKTKTVSSISQPLQRLHMDLFGPTFVKSLMKKMYCLVVTDDYSRLSWVFFLSIKDETSEILKTFITGIENLIDLNVKVIRCDNGNEFKNKVMNQFFEMKGIKREFSVARTPQQNGVAERKNRTLIEAARTMLADSKLPTTFWAEAVNTVCYVQNRVLVIKPQNKTPYELFLGRKPALSFMRPFGCLVTIFNTLDHLGKFDGKADEGFFVGYSTNSKAFRVFNSRTRIVEENLHVKFSKATPNIAGSGPNWLFDIDALTKSMNYEPVVAGNQSNGNAGTKACDDAGKARMETVNGTYYILLPFLTQDPSFSSNSKDSPDAGFKPLGEEEKMDTKNPENENSAVPNTEEPRVNQEQDESINITNNINIVSLTVNTASIEDNALDENIVNGCIDDPNMPNLEEIVYSDDDEEVGAEADMNNLAITVPVGPIPTIKVHKDHPLEQIIRDIHSTPQTRRMIKNVTEHVEPKKVWTLMDLPHGKRAIGTKWVYRNKKDERGIVIRNKARLVTQRYTQEKGIDYDEVFAPFARIKAIRLFLAYASFKDFVVYQMDVKSAFLYGKIEEEIYVTVPSPTTTLTNHLST
ncbi:putative ribonuclease H-like domain-containing protein [Tanacetum coccineum]